ncbi:MAG TPA: hypothetical protein VEU07_03520 [Candidatus Acidoferrum sp.]|nr:hypothetical protein [Candidatus Acidoferrum sp.]
MGADLVSRERAPNRISPPCEETAQIEIAGLVFRIVGLTGPAWIWLRERYRPFLTHKPAEVTVKVTGRQSWPKGRPPRPSLDWDADRFRFNLAACRGEGDLASKHVRLSVPPAPSALGPSVFRILSTILLLQKGGFLLHASGVVADSRAWVFCGPSESGKTTIARMADARPVLSDETVAIAKRARTYVAYSTPFFGEGGPTMGELNTHGRLRGLCFLHKSRQFSHRRLTAREAVERAFPQVFLPKTEPAVVDVLLGCLADFAGRIPCYDLFFPPSPDLWGYLDGIE